MQPNWLQWSIAFAVFLAALDSSITNTLLPVLATTFDVSQERMVQTVFLYQVVLVCLTFPLLQVGEKWGARKLFLIGIGLFGLGAMSCGFSTTYAAFLSGRLIQATGAAAILGLYPTLIKRNVPASELGKWIGISGLLLALGLSFGPSLTALVLQLFAWNYLFFGYFPIVLLVGVALVNLLPTLPTRPTRLYGFQQLFICAGFILFLVGIQWARVPDKGWISVGLLAAGFSLFYALKKWQDRQDVTLFPFVLLQRRAISVSLLSTVLVFSIQSCAYIGLPLILYAQFDFKPTEIGFLISPWPLIGAAISPWAGNLADRWNPNRVSAWGLIGLVVGLLGIALGFDGSNTIWFGISMGICGAGFGLFQIPNIKSVMANTPDELAGKASGLLSVARVIGQALGSLLVASFILFFDYAQWFGLYLLAGIIASFTAALLFLGTSPTLKK